MISALKEKASWHSAVVVQSAPEHMGGVYFQAKAWGVHHTSGDIGPCLKLSPYNADHQEVGNV